MLALTSGVVGYSDMSKHYDVLASDRRSYAFREGFAVRSDGCIVRPTHRSGCFRRSGDAPCCGGLKASTSRVVGEARATTRLSSASVAENHRAFRRTSRFPDGDSAAQSRPRGALLFCVTIMSTPALTCVCCWAGFSRFPYLPHSREARGMRVG